MGRVQGTPDNQTPNPIGTPPNPAQQGGPYPPNPAQQAGPYPPHVQPAAAAGQSPYAGNQGQPRFIGNPWQSGLFECHLDPTNAVMTALFPCVTFGQIAEVMDASEQQPQGSQLSCPFGSCIYLLMMGVCSYCAIGSRYRLRLRNRYGLVEAPYQDGISHLFCPFCSLCQEFRELKCRHLDPALGWAGILAQRQSMQYRNDQTNQPPQPQTMSM